eukprot:m.17722 g.17722  ORF g.17722 m.17722 type:complete len:204 (-) comp5530_c0_seq2:34-645(-)
MANQQEHHVSLRLEATEVQECLSALIHTVFFHRTYGEVRPQDSTCQASGVTFAMCDCPPLIAEVDKVVKQFHKQLAEGSHKSGQISLAFYQTKRKLFGKEDRSVWEHWIFALDIDEATHGTEQKDYRERLAETLSDRLMFIARTVLQQDQHLVPPTDANTADTSLREQPFLHKLSTHLGPPPQPSVMDTVTHMFKNVWGSGLS